MVNIFRHGILSPKTAEEKGLVVRRNYDNGYNKDDEISATESPVITKRRFQVSGQGWSAFDKYIKPGISFVIKDKSRRPARFTNRDSGFADEVYISEEVPPENLPAVMVPPDLLDTTVSQLPINLGFNRYGDFTSQIASATKRVQLINDFLRDECASSIPDERVQSILDPLTKIISDTYKPEGGSSNLGLNREIADKVKEKYEELQIMLQNSIAEGFSNKLGIENPRLRDVLKNYKPSAVGLFDNNGNPIEL